MRVKTHPISALHDGGTSRWRRGTVAFLLLLFSLAMGPWQAFAVVGSDPGASAVVPAHRVTGVVTSADDGQPLPGVNVVLQGTTTGTMTSIDGAYSLDLPDGNGTLVFTFVGFQQQAVPVQGRTTINVELVSETAQLDEVVVTALGIERQRRAISFGTSEVKGPELMQGGSSNAVTALYGKTAGVQIGSTVAGPTGGVNLTIRGVKSLTGSNRPLFIVDGIPVLDRESGFSTTTWDRGTRDLGTGVNDLNTNDIESISVLKGATAAALYGAQAANGVVLITTKKGRKKGGLGVEFSTQATSDHVAFLPKFQNVYGAGVSYLTLSNPNDGYFELDKDGVRMIDRTSYSWGPKMEGQPIRWWDGTMTTYSPQPDNFKDIFEAGSDASTSIALSNATANAVYRIGYTRRDFSGTVVGVGEERNTLSLTSNLDISTRLKADIALNYYNSNTHNPPPKLYVGYDFPRSIRTDIWKERYKDEKGYLNTVTQYPRLAQSEQTLMQEMLWNQIENSYDFRKDRLVGSVALNYNLLDWLTMRVKAGTDLDNRNREQKEKSTRPSVEGATGYYGVTRWQDRITYGEAIVQAQRELTPDIGLDILVGGSTTRTYLSENSVSTNGGLVVENWFSMSNSRLQRNNNAWRAEEQTDGIFGSGQVSYKNYLFLTATARNDWTSTLPTDNNSYFYPSFGLSYVFSDAFELPKAISYGQFRANYAEVGRGAPRYAANRAYNYGNWEGVTTNSFNTTVPPLGLKPERKKEAEVGLTMAFFGDRLGFDLSYYNQRNIDQIMNLSVAHSSGAAAVTVNAGELVNSGFDAQIYGTPVKMGGFQWDATLNMSRNRNEVKSLYGTIQSLTLENVEDNLFIEARPGQPFGEIYGYDFARNEQGQILVDQNGYQVKSDKLTRVGNTTPDLIGGFINTFRYKNLSLTAVIDYRIGGDIISISNYYGNTTGKWESTLNYRDEASGGLPYYVDANGAYVPLQSHTATTPNGEQVYHDGMIAEGVQEIRDANGNVTGYKQNETLIPVWDHYLTTYAWKTSGIYPQAVYDNSYAKMRELVLGFQVPLQLLRGVPVQSLNISLLGRNLFYIFKNVPNIDPESSIGTDSRLQGYEYAYYPTSRSFGFRINASF